MSPGNPTAGRYLALGDSYTVGEGVAAGAGWPGQLVRALAAGPLRLGAPEIVATTGWTTDELLAALAKPPPQPPQPPQPPYALVSLLIGVNNQYRGRTLDNYRREFHQLLQFAISMAGHAPARVLVVSIPDWGVTRFAADEARDPDAIAREIDAFNAAAREEAARAGCRFADITPISRACGADPALLAADGLHPSAAQYARWLPPIVAAARKCLRDGTPASSRER